MNYEAIIDFNKYTLAVAAAGIVYALEKLSPTETPAGRILLLGVLGVLLSSAVVGVVVFAAATKAQSTPKRLDKVISHLGTAHVIMLLVGLIGLAGMLIDRVIAPPQSGAQSACQCTPMPPSRSPASSY